MVLEFFGESYWGVSGDKAAVLAVFWYGGGVGLIVSYFWRSGFDFLNWVFLIICRRMWGKLFNFFWSIDRGEVWGYTVIIVHAQYDRVEVRGTEYYYCEFCGCAYL